MAFGGEPKLYGLLVSKSGQSKPIRKHFVMRQSVNFEYFRAALKSECLFLDPELENIKDFFYIDKDEEIFVFEERGYNAFLLWVKEMRAAGKALDVNVKVYL